MLFEVFIVSGHNILTIPVPHRGVLQSRRDGMILIIGYVWDANPEGMT